MKENSKKGRIRIKQDGNNIIIKITITDEEFKNHILSDEEAYRSRGWLIQNGHVLVLEKTIENYDLSDVLITLMELYLIDKEAKEKKVS